MQDFALGVSGEGNAKRNMRRNQKMLNENKQIRVLSRMGARVLTPEESEQINGSTGFVPTLLSVIHTLNGADTRLDE